MLNASQRHIQSDIYFTNVLNCGAISLAQNQLPYRVKISIFYSIYTFNLIYNKSNSLLIL